MVLSDTLSVGDSAPNFELLGDDEESYALGDFRGAPLVLYFYPKDNTPGCTIEAQDFRDLMDGFNTCGAKVVGVSADDLSSHKAFKKQKCLPFTLLVDTNNDLAKKYGVFVIKKMFGKEYMGINRSTFLIDADGKIKKIWRSVKVRGHAAEVLNSLSG